MWIQRWDLNQWAIFKAAKDRFWCFYPYDRVLHWRVVEQVTADLDHAIQPIHHTVIAFGQVDVDRRDRVKEDPTTFIVSRSL